MTHLVTIHRAGPAMSLQDAGRPNYVDRGLSRGGAADPLALIEAAALLGSQDIQPAIEMVGSGGVFSVTAPTRFALSGAPMQARVGDRPLEWPASHQLLPGETLTIGGATAGNYGYLTFAGGFDLPPILGSLSTHFAAGIGAGLGAGQSLPLVPDPNPDGAALTMTPAPRFDGGDLRVMPGPQSGLFSESTRARFFDTSFRRGGQANRQGVALDFDGAPFGMEPLDGLASDFITTGDIQMTGRGMPFVLLCESQTMGGYPRIGTVVPADLALVAQAPAGAVLTLRAVSVEEADALTLSTPQLIQQARGQIRPLYRDPAQLQDLLTYQLISGVTAGDDLERDQNA